MTIAILKSVRLSYPDLWKPGKPLNDGDTPKYGGQFIYDDGTDNATVAKNAFIASAQEVFGENWQAIVGAMEKSKKCIRKGNENLTKDGAIRDGYKDKLYIVARNKVKPLIIGPVRTMPKGHNEDGKFSDGFPILTEAGGKPFGGCYVNVKVDIKAMKGREKIPNQIYAALLTVQFVADGPAFGAAPGTAEGFDDVEGAAPVGGGAAAVADNDLF